MQGPNEGLTSSEGTVDGVEDLIDIDMLLEDDNFIPIAFNWPCAAYSHLHLCKYMGPVCLYFACTGES